MDGPCLINCDFELWVYQFSLRFLSLEEVKCCWEAI